MAAVTSPIDVNIEDGVAVLRIDDGKANVVSHAFIDQMNDALDMAAEDATAIAIVGREGKFSAGFDLSVMSGGAEAVRGLVGGGGEMLMRIYTHPQPVVAAVTGHALAAGALLCLASDTRIGSADIPAKIGLNETAIGMGLPWYGVRLGEARLSKRYLTRSVLQAEIFDMEGALAAGYLDELVPAADLETTAIERARQLGQLPAAAHAITKSRLRQALADEILAGLDADMAKMAGPG